MNSGNVTVKRTTNTLLAAYNSNRKALVKVTEQAPHDAAVDVARQLRIRMGGPARNPWL